jgi:hypothetical protein
MTDFNNLTGLEKPLTKLIETIGEGLGVVGNAIFKFDAKKLKRIGEIDAENDKKKIIKKAEGEAKAIEVLERASKRFALELYSKQINLENIIVKSHELLQNQEVSDEPVDKDWAARFLSVAQDVSKEEMQDILAKILAGEVKEPSTFSIKTLDIVKNLGKKELEEFKKFAGFCTPNAGLFMRSPGDNEELEKYGLIFGSFLHLADSGLFNPSTTLSLKLNLNENQAVSIQITQKIFIFKSIAEQKISLPLLRLTETGMQILKFIQESKPSKVEKLYIDDMVSFFKSKQLELYKNDHTI